MKKRLFFTVGFFLLLLNDYAQGGYTVRPLSVGDSVPETVLKNIFGYESTVDVRELRGKLIILDFWATWCTSCIHHFPVLQYYQDKFGDNIQIVLINSKKTGDNEEKISAALARQNKSISGGLHLPSVVLDTVAESLFPHHLLPHYVWISPDGKVAAITGSEEVTAENIDRLLKGKEEHLAEKKDMDVKQPLFISDLEDRKAFFHSVFIKGSIAGLPTTNVEQRKMGCFGRTFANSTILELYLAAANSISSTSIDLKKTIFDADDPSLRYPQHLDDTSKLRWVKNNQCTYQLLIPAPQKDSFSLWMLEDLNRVSGYYGKIEKRKIQCLVLRAKKSLDKVATGGGMTVSDLYNDSTPTLINSPISHLIDRLNDLEFFTLPVIDETGITKNVDIRFQEKFSQPEQVKKELKRYGLELAETQRLTEVLVIAKK